MIFRYYNSTDSDGTCIVNGDASSETTPDLNLDPTTYIPVPNSPLISPAVGGCEAIVADGPWIPDPFYQDDDILTLDRNGDPRSDDMCDTGAIQTNETTVCEAAIDVYMGLDNSNGIVAYTNSPSTFNIWRHGTPYFNVTDVGPATWTVTNGTSTTDSSAGDLVNYYYYAQSAECLFDNELSEHMGIFHFTLEPGS